MVYRPGISGRGPLASMIMISCIIAIIAFVIASVAPTAEAAKAKQLSDLEKATQYYNKGKYEQAIPLLKKHIETKPEPDALYMLGYSLYKLGRHEEARKYFKESYLVAPEYSPTPKLEKKLNRRLKTARPGTGDIKRSVPEGELPPEAQGLDPSEYKVIDKSTRLKMPETSKSTDTFQPAQARKTAPSKKTGPVKAVAKKEAPKPVTETGPVPDKPSEVTAQVPATAAAVENKPAPATAMPPSPAVENQPAPSAVPATPAEDKPAPRPTPRQVPSARPAAGPAKNEGLLGKIQAFLPDGMSLVTVGVMAGGLVLYLILTLLMVRSVKKNNLMKPLIALAIVPVLQLLVILLAKRAAGKPSSAAGAGDMLDLSGEPDLDLPDMDDMGFDMDDDAFASNEGFGSDEGVGEHTDDFGTAESESGGSDDFDMDLEPDEDDFNTSGADDDFNMNDMSMGDMDSADNSDEDDSDGFGMDFDDKSF